MGRGKSGFDQFITGLIFTGVFGFLWMRSGAWWWVFPAAFAGVMPMISGIRKMAARAFMPRQKKEEILEQQKISRERQILQVAKNHNGVVTPAIAALDTGSSMEEMDTVLGDMAKKGYAQAEVEDSGRLVYIFADFAKKDQLNKIEE
jgi:N-glycosylase/DNA lyase